MLIVTNQMNLGGTEKALLGMLKSIEKNKYDVTIMLAKEGGKLKNEIPKWIKVKSIPYFGQSIKSICLNNIRNMKILELFKGVYYWYKMKTVGHYGYYYYLSKLLPKLKQEYDVAISYYMPSEFSDYYVINNVKALKKVTFVHSDITRLENIDNKLLEKIYSEFDNIFGVSRDVCNIICSNIKGIEKKVSTFYNIISDEDVLKLASIPTSFGDEFSGIRIVTVGRLSTQKGQDLIPEICQKLVKDGYKFKWYIIGDGYLNNLIDIKIRELHIERNLVILGPKLNPYPFIRDCDIYVQPSRCEGYATTITEAKILSKPIVMTNVASAKEQILHMYNGLIVEINVDEIYEGIKNLIDNEQLRNKFEYNLKKEKIDYTQEINKLYNVIDKGKINY